MSILPPSPFCSAVAHPATVDEAAALSVPKPDDAAAEPFESPSNDGGPEKAPLAVPPNNDQPVGFLEPFSEYAHRRCMDKISPPLPKAERDIDSIGLSAVCKALNIHPRDLDLDPPPLFLRSPSQKFIRALFELGR